jgi:hypothetical protein
LLFIDRNDNYSFEKLEKKYKGNLAEAFASRDSRAESVSHKPKESMNLILTSLFSQTPMI